LFCWHSKQLRSLRGRGAESIAIKIVSLNQRASFDERRIDIWCKDPALTYLNKDGYNVVRVPRTGIEPLDVLGRDGKSVEKLGSLCEIWKSTELPPKASDPQPSANISGQKTQSLDLGIGLKMLAGVLSGMGSGAGLPSLQSSYKSSRSVEFKFVDVYSVSVTPFALGNYLAQGSLNLANPVVQAYFGNEETDEFVITDVLKTSSVSVTVKGDKATARVNDFETGAREI
jgi:hypothetical protein